MLKTIPVHIVFFFLAFYVTFVTFSQKKREYLSLFKLPFNPKSFLFVQSSIVFESGRGGGDTTKKSWQAKEKMLLPKILKSGRRKLHVNSYYRKIIAAQRIAPTPILCAWGSSFSVNYVYTLYACADLEGLGVRGHRHPLAKIQISLNYMKKSPKNMPQTPTDKLK